MKTIGQQLNWDFEANGSLEIKDKNGRIYWEDSSGCWTKREYDSKGREIYYENSSGYWIKKEFDSKGKEIYCENSSHGVIHDIRPKPCEDKVIEIEGVKYKLTKV